MALSRALMTPAPSWEKLVDVGRSALVAQSARIDAIDLKAYGLLSFDGALIAANIAAKKDLGGHWWTAIIGLGISICYASIATAGSEEAIEMGPYPKKFYDEYQSKPNELLSDLLKDLEWALDKNREREERKRSILAIGAGFLLVTAVYSAFAFAFWR